MIFIVLCAVVILTVCFSFWNEGNFVIAILQGIIALLLVIVPFFILFSVIPPNDKTEVGGTESLQALSTSSSIQGRSFFLGSGYINGVRTLNFIVHQSDGGFRVEQANASDSLIYEGTQQPIVSMTFHSYSNGWVIPWDIRQSTTYRFDVPAGSVLEGYTVDNGGGR